MFIGVIVGGRLGYVLFYGFSYFLSHPLAIFAVWQGGMSSHGGFIGVTLAILFFCKRNRIHPLALADVLMVPVAIGLALGRIGNLINGELYGTLSTVPWAMHFPGIDGLRHPTQIYAFLKDLCIATASVFHLRFTMLRPREGRTTSYFLMSYAVLRSIVEIFRDQPFGFVNLGILSLSWGQIYTIPIFLGGVSLWIFAGVRSRRQLP
jgi:phosphatidylglycerol:prolipoprotein diacylglycerol transferase